LEKLTIPVLVVDDYTPWYRLVCALLGKRPGFQVVGEVSDGLEAVQQAQELQPGLILLDIGLRSLNGIEAARRVREVPNVQNSLRERIPLLGHRARRSGSGAFGGDD